MHNRITRDREKEGRKDRRRDRHAQTKFLKWQNGEDYIKRNKHEISFAGFNAHRAHCAIC